MKSKPSQETILIVDDNPESIWPLIETLETDYEILCAAGSEETMNIAFSQHPPDLIMLDIMMPDMDGYEVCRRLKADELTRDIPVIFLTSKAKDLEEVKGLELGAQDYITKPFSLPVVRSRIKNVLNFKKEMERRLLLKQQLEELNQQLERQVQQKMRELQEARETLQRYDEKYTYLFQERPVDSRPKNILAVDDHPENLHILVEHLEGEYDVMLATSGEKALEIAFSENRPDLIVLDIMMPGMNGYEVCARLKAHVDTHDIPVIFVTALGEEVDETKGLNLGAIDFITKPFSVPVVKARLKAALHLKDEMDRRMLLTQKLEGLNRNLELRVQEKTAALQQAHENLKVSEKKYRAIYENAIEGIFQTTPDGRILSVSPSLARMLGYDSPFELLDSITDLPNQLYVQPQKRAEFTRILSEKGEITGFETQLRKKSGTPLWVLICARTFRDEESNIYYQGSLIDISEQKRAQEELRKYHEHLEELVAERTTDLQQEIAQRTQIQKELQHAKENAEAANHAKSLFLANMSHELRTPLNAILGFAQLLQREASLTSSQQDKLGRILRSGEHLLLLINNVLDLSKVEASRMTLQLTTVDLWNLLAMVEEMLRERAEKKGLRFSIRRGSGVPRHIKADETKLRQILVNLLGNAIKFTEQGGVTLEISHLEEAHQATSAQASQLNHLTFNISDTGIGVMPDKQETIFDPFEQSRQSPHSPEGTGLGLALTRSFVRLMGGEVYVTSNPGKGSCFSFDIPVEQVEAVTTQAVRPCREVIDLSPNQPEYRILVVDDDRNSRIFLTELLRSVGFTGIREAPNGQDALAQFERWRPQVIFMDMRMPMMDGYEATRRIRDLEARDARSQTSSGVVQIPIIALTSSVFEEETTKIFDAGCNILLRKPIKATEIFEALRLQLGVRYVYKETECDRNVSGLQEQASKETLTPEALSALPPDLLHELERALLTGNKTTIERVIESIRSCHPAVADAMAVMVLDFKYQTIWSMIQEIRQKGD